MDRPLDDLIKERQGASRKNNNNNNKQNKGFSKMKGSIGGGGRQERRQKQEPYAHKVVFQPPQQRLKFQEAPKPKKEPVLTFSVNNTQAATPQQFTQPKVFAVSQTQTSHSQVISPPQQVASAFIAPQTTTGGGQKLSIFERIGAPKAKPGAITSGTSVTIGNINHDVTLADLSELCGAIGEVLGVSFALTASKTKKQANVIFARRSDAITFVQKFHNLPLDGVPLSVCLTGENGKENPFNPFPAGIATENDTAANKNVRSGLFGTHLGANAADDEEEEVMYEGDVVEEQYPQQINYAVPIQSAASNQRFSVTMKGAGGFGGQRQQQPSFQQPQQQYQNRNGGGNRGNNNNGGGFRGNNSSANNRGGSGGGRGGGGTKKAVVSENDLDNALASYMATR